MGADTRTDLGHLVDLVDELRGIGADAGLAAVGVAPASPFHGTFDVLTERKAAGLHGGMHFTYGNPVRSTDPQQTLPGAHALVVGAYAYGRRPGPDVDTEERNRPLARIARYSWRDFYAPLRSALGAIGDRLSADGWQARVVADDNALVDREAAYRAGLGWYGKNANLLLPGKGSWFVLGSVITDAPLPPAEELVADGCKTCHRCLPACPTGALIAPGVLDARRCLAWLVEAPGWFPAEQRVALGNRLYGCDECQEVCPPNRAAATEDNLPLDDGAEATVDVLAILTATDDELLERFGRWYIPRRQPRYIRRNALVVLGNTADGQDGAVEQILRAALDDADPIIRGHAVWAAARLGRHDLLPDPAAENDADVQAELLAAG